MTYKGSWPRGRFSSYCVVPCANRDRITNIVIDMPLSPTCNVITKEYDHCKECVKINGKWTEFKEIV